MGMATLANLWEEIVASYKNNLFEMLYLLVQELSRDQRQW